MPHIIDPDQCISCGACETECPEDAIHEGDDCYMIDPEVCTDCGSCAAVCPQECIFGPDDDSEAPLDDEASGPDRESEYD